MILREFKAPVDLSPHTGIFEEVLTDSPARAQVAKIAKPASIEERAAPGANFLPIEDGQADLVVNLLGLHWANDLPGP